MAATRWLAAVTIAAVAGIAVPVIPAWAGAPTDQVKQYTDEVVRILDDPSLRSADKRAAVRKVAGDVFDVTETAKRLPNVPIVALVETARGLERITEIAAAKGTFRLAFGIGDFRRDTGFGE